MELMLVLCNEAAWIGSLFRRKDGFADKPDLLLNLVAQVAASISMPMVSSAQEARADERQL